MGTQSHDHLRNTISETFMLDYLVRKPPTHEIHLQEEKKEPAPQQGVALKPNDIEMKLDKSENDEYEH